jgi:hypothetical protein
MQQENIQVKRKPFQVSIHDYLIQKHEEDRLELNPNNGQKDIDSRMVMLCWLLKKHIIPLFILFELITKMLTQR